MKCDCGYPAFYYRAFVDNKKYDVYKCGHTNVDSKKKTKCEMDLREYIEDIPITHDDVAMAPAAPKEQENTEENLKQEIRKYIHLCEITKYKKENYIANINQLLRRLNFRLFFPERETLESLKARLNNKSTPRLEKKSMFPMNILEYPESFKIKQTEPKRKKETKKSSVSKSKGVFIPNVDTQPRWKTEELPTDSESDDETGDMDNTFDIDNYDSGEEIDVDDGGAFSD